MGVNSSKQAAAVSSPSSTGPMATTAAIPIFHVGPTAHIHRTPTPHTAAVAADTVAASSAGQSQARGSDGTERAQCGGAYIVRPTAAAVANDPSTALQFAVPLSAKKQQRVYFITRTAKKPTSEAALLNASPIASHHGGAEDPDIDHELLRPPTE